ncbi:DNA topoisomerase IB [Sphingomonas sabuli]|uniref:DNA topoisomerase n=1 Tax=Sphingomonas sabuli TaxID=2764186 RepID=A0A7G9L4D5_9SPHN|nr:DNA topoisomerase IB [Sphingomonas sabuli]QNM83484.1 DNA topoisomerase IB [Sphingomonas sabuli]
MPEQSQRLRHCSDSEPGFTRKKQGRYWAYFDQDGKRITDRETIERLNSVALPPAYTDAWYCPHANGHLQATGIDARGRKQYRYHPNYRARADKKKFQGLTEFGNALPKIRSRVEHDLSQRGLSREKVLAAVVRLLDTQYLRVGNERYAKENNSFGATTLLCRHVNAGNGKVKMRFRGKHGKTKELTITDRRLGRIVRKCKDLPGQSLFQYVNGDGEAHPVSSADVNDYLHDIAGDDFTAKHFRTWWASVIAMGEMLDAEDEKKISVNTMLEPVAEALGNTVAISRKSYVHPALIEAVKDNPRDPLGGQERPRDRKWLSSTEVAFLKFLEHTYKPRARRAA